MERKLLGEGELVRDRWTEREIKKLYLLLRIRREGLMAQNNSLNSSLV